ncbi:MAG: AMP-binding protein, partial [Pseudomonadota bacterium]
MPNPLFDTLFRRHAGSAAAFLRLQTGETTSYAAFLAQAARIAHTLRAQGLQPGDRVAVQVPKSPEALAVYAASIQAGFVFLPLNPAYTGEEMRYFLEDSDARLLICESRAAPAFSGARKVLTLDADGSGTLRDTARGMPDSFPTEQRGAEDLAALLYTSGTTGRSKGAMLTQRNLISNAETLTEYWRFTSDDVLLHALPIFHTHGLFVATNIILLSGGAMIFLPKFDADTVVRLMPKATSMMGVPTFYT